jgi:hypothetical protein
MSYVKGVSIRRLEVIITFAMTQEAVSRLSRLTESAPIANVTPVTIARPLGIPSQVVAPSTFDYPQKYASHMVGKGGENVQRLHQKYDVNVQINDDKVQLKDYAGVTGVQIVFPEEQGNSPRLILVYESTVPYAEYPILRGKVFFLRNVPPPASPFIYVKLAAGGNSWGHPVCGC